MTYLEQLIGSGAVSKNISSILNKLLSNVDITYKNVDGRILQVVDEKYKHQDYVIVDGEIYVVKKFLKCEGKDRLFLGQKLKFDMSTTKEFYQVREFDVLDSDGEYDYTDYEIELYKEEK